MAISERSDAACHDQTCADSAIVSVSEAQQDINHQQDHVPKRPRLDSGTRVVHELSAGRSHSPASSIPGPGIGPPPPPANLDELITKRCSFADSTVAASAVEPCRAPMPTVEDIESLTLVQSLTAGPQSSPSNNLCDSCISVPKPLDETSIASIFDSFPHADVQRGIAAHEAAKHISLQTQTYGIDVQCLMKVIIWLQGQNELLASQQHCWTSVFEGNRPFWEQLSLLMAVYYLESFAPSIAQSFDASNCVSTLISQHVSLIQRMLAVDVAQLEMLDATSLLEQSPVCTQQLTALNALLVEEQSWFCQILGVQKHSALAANILTSTSIVQDLILLEAKILDCSLRMIDPLDFPHIIEIINTFVSNCVRVSYSGSKGNEQLAIDRPKFAKLLVTLFEQNDDRLCKNLNIHHDALNKDHRQQAHHLMINILLQALDLDTKSCELLVRAILHDSALLEHAELPSLVSAAWQIRTFKRYILEGCMELRVCGTELLSQMFLDLYKQYSGAATPRPRTDHPVLRRVARIVLDDELVERWISVATHPQLVTRLGKVVAFLVVTDSFTEQKARPVWRQMLTVHDPAIQSALLDVVRSIIPLLDVQQLLHLCREVIANPLSTSGLDVVQFYDAIFSKILDNKTEISSNVQLQSNVMDFCVCLVCLAPTARHAAVEDFLIQNAHTALKLFSKTIGAEARFQLYNTWTLRVQDDSCKGQVMLALFTVLQTTHSDYEFVTLKLDLTQIAINALCEQIDDWKSKKEPLGKDLIGLLNTWLKLPILLFTHLLADSHTGHLQRLWSYAFGSEAINDESRDLAWHLLHTIVDEFPENMKAGTFESLYTIWIPSLKPEHYVSRFAIVVESIVRRLVAQISPVSRSESDNIISLPGLNILWNVIVSASNAEAFDRSSRFLVDLLVNRTQVSSFTSQRAENIHIQLVQQCLSALGSIEHPTQSIDNIKRCRIIGFLTLLQSRLCDHSEFTQIIAPARANESPGGSSPPCLITSSAERIYIPYCLSSARGSPRNDWLTISNNANRQELHTRIGDDFGMTKFKTILQGQILELLEEPMQSLQDLDIVRKGRLLIVEAPAESLRHSNGRNLTQSSYEIELQSHFPELYVLLKGNGELSVKIFQLLASLAPNDRIVRLLKEGLDAFDQIFPDYGLESLYSLRCMKTLVGLQGWESASTDADTYPTMLGLLQRLLLSLPLDQPVEADPLLLMVWSDTVAVSRKCLDSLDPGQQSSLQWPSHSIDKLFNILSIFLANEADIITICDTYSILLNVALRNNEDWQCFSTDTRIVAIHSDLLLGPPCAGIRAIVRDNVSRCSRELLDDTSIETGSYIGFYWTQCRSLIDESFRKLGNAAAFYALLQELFEMLYKTATYAKDDAEKMAELHKDCFVWIQNLLSHQYPRHGDSPTSNGAFSGLVLLTTQSFLVLQEQSAISLDKLEHAGFQVWDSFLFPAANKPILNSFVRHQIYDLFCSISIMGQPGLLKIVADRLFPLYDAVDDRDWQIDQDKIMRPSCGQVGLRNLGNTCYLSSLMTQLYMFPTFRGFMTHNIPDTSASGMLEATRNLFCEMKYSLEPCADPEAFARQVRTYTGASINVAEQMDVEEFFNLIFEQWEDQLVSHDSKQRFRSIFGAEIIYQIKSLECEHISERTEPSLNIQCDVQGKENLEESLAAYIAGDVMHGDNKYKCESCDGKLVQAVRRTCLKDIPDNLILHLKRFEYDIHSQQRQKINARFEFPHELNMTPYSFQQLSQPEKHLADDMFELVGVLVHKGQAEYGHYVSCIRTRPEASDSTPQWLLFDDSEVTEFDPQDIANLCFGGVDDAKVGLNTAACKAHSAYMLFYQRASTLDASRSSESGIVAANLSQKVEYRLQARNDQIMRSHCLFADPHQGFISKFSQFLQVLPHSPAVHPVLASMIISLWSSIYQVNSRCKDLSCLQELIDKFLGLIQSCEQCTATILSYLWNDVERLRDLLTRTPIGQVRGSIQNFILQALKVVHDRMLEEKHERTDKTNLSRNIMCKMLEALWQLAQYHLHYSVKGWVEYWNMISQITMFSTVQCRLMVELKYFMLCLQQLSLEWPTVRRALQDYKPLALMLHKRDPPVNYLVYTFLSLLRHVSISDECATDSSDEDEADEVPMPLIPAEKSMLCYTTTDGIHWLNRVFENWEVAHGTQGFAPHEILELLLFKQPDLVFESNILHTIRSGIDNYTAAISDLFLSSAAICLKHCSNMEDARKMIQLISHVALTEERHNKLVILQFWMSASSLVNAKLPPQNGSLSSFYDLVVQEAPICVPSILMPTQTAAIRLQTMVFLHGLIFRYPIIDSSTDDSPTAADMLRVKSVRILGRKCLQEATTLLYCDPPVAKHAIAPLVDCAKACAEFIDGLIDCGDNAEPLRDIPLDNNFRTSLNDVLQAYQAQPEMVDYDTAQSDTSMTDFSDENEEDNLTIIY